MFDTGITVVGNVLNEPETRLTKTSQTMVTSFKVATHARRFDKAVNGWVDAASLRLRVTCWKRLAENVGRSVKRGDPVIVTGNLSCRDWMGDDKIRRVSYELDAVSVGHDLTRGTAAFARQRAVYSTSATDDGETELRIAGEETEEFNAARGLDEFDRVVEDPAARIPAPGLATFEDLINDLEQTTGDASGGASGGAAGGSDGADAAAVAAAGVAAVGGGSGDEAEPDGDGSGDDAGGDDDVVVEPARKRRRREPVGV
jgi:single-strand DNA-binding protein